MSASTTSAAAAAFASFGCRRAGPMLGASRYQHDEERQDAHSVRPQVGTRAQRTVAGSSVRAECCRLSLRRSARGGSPGRACLCVVVLALACAPRRVTADSDTVTDPHSTHSADHITVLRYTAYSTDLTLLDPNSRYRKPYYTALHPATRQPAPAPGTVQTYIVSLFSNSIQTHQRQSPDFLRLRL